MTSGPPCLASRVPDASDTKPVPEPGASPGRATSSSRRPGATPRRFASATLARRTQAPGLRCGRPPPPPSLPDTAERAAELADWPSGGISSAMTHASTVQGFRAIVFPQPSCCSAATASVPGRPRQRRQRYRRHVREPPDHEPRQGQAVTIRAEFLDRGPARRGGGRSTSFIGHLRPAEMA